MKKMMNKDFKFLIQNLLSTEEHLVDMLNEENKNKIIAMLRDIKEQRNFLLDFPEEKDRNKWCAYKHIILSQYHLLELINNNKSTNIEIEKFLFIYKKLDKLSEEYINSDIKSDCNNCKEDLIIDKIKKRILK